MAIKLIIKPLEIRLCGNEWVYCDGVCSRCLVANKYYSTSATTKPQTRKERF